MTDLSVIIPARNEEFLNRTVHEVLSKSTADTECIVVLDGAWPDEPLEQHDRLHIIYNPVAIGQRASINVAARMSRAQYIMKLDAHCILDQGYDTKLIESAKELGCEVTQVPMMYNLHAFDWVCPDGHRRYQSPSGPCQECGKPTTKDIVWKRRLSRKTYIWRFDQSLKFDYWGDAQRRHTETYVETMSLLGACFFMDREWYWELGGSDEDHGSWGQQGTEIACKTWLSGGRLICNRKVWFAHMFRTQGKDFGFPYPLTDREVERARQHSNDVWKNGKFPKAIHDLDWLFNKFSNY
jgi:glycosyltransferase involved in cell wall biosynthesis